MAGPSRHVLSLLVCTAAIAPLQAVSAFGVSAQAPTVPVAQEFEKLHFRSIGPTIMSGRVADLAVHESNPATFYVGTAHGGLWKTTNNGTTFTPLFQDQGLISIGDVTMSQTNPELIWVGTGESNNRQSTSWGDGVYKSADGGKTFTHMGLAESKHINRIVIDPTNNDIVLVAATGPLFGAGGERGIYKTTDGGKTWKQVLAVDAETGANDLVMSASDPKLLFASTYQRRRTACCMNGGGPGSGIWKSTNGGDSWTRLSGGGLPSGPLGRIGMDAFRGNSNIVYASIEAPTVTAAPDTAGGANASATGVYRSDDGGTTWTKVSPNNPRPMYFSHVLVDPTNADRLYMGGVGLQMSIDGGKSFATDAAMATHDDVHAMWVNPKNPDHILIGNDGGIAMSYDMSKTWQFFDNIPAGLFYHASYDMEKPFNVCGGMQDNYNWCGPSASRFGRGIMSHEWFQILGGDGFVAIPDLRDSRIIYTESQDGNIIRRNKVTGESKQIRPSVANILPALAAGAAAPPIRFQWDTPMIFSPHDPGVLLVGANRLYKSTDRGDSWTALSADLTTDPKRDEILTMGVKNTDITIARNDGIVSWGTLVQIAESPKQAGVYLTGSDDGVVSMSRDGGRTWTDVTSRLPGFPAGGYVSEVVASRFDAATIYVSVDNHRVNDYNTYMWASSDGGATFRSITGGLVGQVVKTMTEDQRNPDVLYAGTETGIMLTLDRGRTWRRLKANLPTVRVDEITLHPRDNAMIVATHGRALWILDHLEPIQEYTAAQAASADAKLYAIPSALQWKPKDDRNDEFWGHAYFLGENPPADAVISYHVNKPITGDARLRITDARGTTMRELYLAASRKTAGVQTACWDMRVDPIPTPPGAAAAGGRGQGAGGAAAGGGRGQGARANIPGVPTAIPAPGYMAANPCVGGTVATPPAGMAAAPTTPAAPATTPSTTTAVTAAPQVGFGGGGAAAGPHVMPGTYNVALIIDGKVVDTKPMRIIADPAVQMTVADRSRYNDVVMDLHDLQRRGTAVMAKLVTLNPQLIAADEKVKTTASLPADVKRDYDELRAEFDQLRARFGVAANAGIAPVAGAAPGGGAGGGGGAGNAAASMANVLGRTSTLKNAISGIWEMPSDVVLRQYADVRTSLPKAISDANAFLRRASSVANAVKPYGIMISIPQ